LDADCYQLKDKHYLKTERAKTLKTELFILLSKVRIYIIHLLKGLNLMMSIEDVNKFKTFYDYWLELRGGQLVPSKADFDPSKVLNLMSIINIWQIVPPDRVEVRLMGTGVVEHARVEKRGRNLLNSFREDQKDYVFKSLVSVCDEPTTAVANFRRHYTSAQTSDVKAAYFPFSSANGEVDIVMSVNIVNKISVKRISPSDKETYIEILDISVHDIGNGVPDWTFETTSD
jgi:hypothetical protein